MQWMESGSAVLRASKLLLAPGSWIEVGSTELTSAARTATLPSAATNSERPGAALSLVGGLVENRQDVLSGSDEVVEGAWPFSAGASDGRPMTPDLV
jgi:hypothetical protein